LQHWSLRRVSVYASFVVRIRLELGYSHSSWLNVGVTVADNKIHCEA